MDAEAPPASVAAGPTDEELLAASRQGDSAALETLLLRYQPRLYRFGLRMCGNVDDAGEIAQESLISMARSLADFRGDSSISSWLYTIARRFCIKKRRRSKFAPAGEEALDAPGSTPAAQLADSAPNPEQAASNRELAAALTRAIGTLDPAQREVLVLRDVEGLPASDVAAILHVSVEAVKSRLHRARVALRAELAPVLGRPASGSSPEPTCPDVLTLFSRHLEGEIDPGVCARLEAHLEQCAHCRHACASLKQTLAVCRQLPTPEVPPSLAVSLRNAVAALRGRR
jgi:RNA polymerase sigma-70 factor (ECF subfamily)